VLDSGLTEIEHTLSNYHLDHENDPLLVVIFDEISRYQAFQKTTKASRYIALNRVISCISQQHRVWYLFMSTESKLSEILPPDRLCRSGLKSVEFSYRGQYSLKRYVPPFTEFALDKPDFKDFTIDISDPDTAL
jgi:hypothetical protein